ncbi:MAG: hypothetical protein PVI19_15740, partial [Syntrophobacterales bacterium]
MKCSTGQTQKKFELNFAGSWSMKQTLLSLLIFLLMASCGTQGPEEEILEVRISEVGIESKAVSEI